MTRPAPKCPSCADLAEKARALADAEKEYRRLHDLTGDETLDTGRAWDRMRNAGDALRASLPAASAKENHDA